MIRANSGLDAPVPLLSLLPQTLPTALAPCKEYPRGRRRKHGESSRWPSHSVRTTSTPRCIGIEEERRVQRHSFLAMDDNELISVCDNLKQLQQVMEEINTNVEGITDTNLKDKMSKMSYIEAAQMHLMMADISINMFYGGFCAWRSHP